MHTVNVFEIYASIQGESSHAGYPCVFVRLAGCNLECVYCDSTKAVQAEGKPMGVDEVLDKIKTFGINMVEVTGGEPLLQSGATVLLIALMDSGYKTLVETNGTVDLADFPHHVQYIVDIKTPGSGHGESFLESNYKQLKKCDEVKFVITSKADFDWARGIAESGVLDSCGQILYSPAHGMVEAKDLAEWIVTTNAPGRLNLQLHKLIWGHEAEGV